MLSEQRCVEQGEADLSGTDESQPTRRNTATQDLTESFPPMTPPEHGPLCPQDNKSVAHKGFFNSNAPQNCGGARKKREPPPERETLKKHVASSDASVDYQNEPNGEKNHDASQNMRLPPCMWNDSLSKTLCNALKNPPVTTDSLNELDLQWIQNNVNLRIDINFDHDLHFMPVTGARGKQKQEEARTYWTCLATEFRVYQHDSTGSCLECHYSANTPIFFTQRLRIMFLELRNLLTSLVPDQDREEVENNMDVDLLMQQVQHGVLDVVGMSKWLASLLTKHCAPMRDEWADDMAAKITDGARQGDMVSIVAGLEKLFSFLEAMKLDVANHQIRTFRYPLIEDGVAFQRDYFSTRITNGKVKIAGSRAWYRKMHFRIPSTTKFTPFSINALIHGLVQLSVNPGSTAPTTLKHDLTRIRQIRDEFQDILHMTMCLWVFDGFIHSYLGPNCNPSAMHPLLKSRVMTLTDVDPDTDFELTASSSSAATPNSDSDSDGGHTDVPSIWQSHISKLSIEITCAASAVIHRANLPLSDDLVRRTENTLNHAFTSRAFRSAQSNDLAKTLEAATLAHVAAFHPMSALEISEAQKSYHNHQQGQNTSSPQHSKLALRDRDEGIHHPGQSSALTTTTFASVTVAGRTTPELDDIARRIAHMAVIHWRVWADMVYL